MGNGKKLEKETEPHSFGLRFLYGHYQLKQLLLQIHQLDLFGMTGD
ncbi:MAG: hypothetical protein CM1200mP30_09110 [Pseudomonadota bacterium]|nr:MAG: hypothetical protein CM1200mP30_09110 [Pseudomonadota bacterium]